MDGLILFGAIILFSILEKTLKKKKAGQQPPPGQQSDGGQHYPSAEADLPTYDADGSYDDQYANDDIPGEPLPQYRRAHGATEGSTPRAVTQSAAEALIPADVWEEIAGLVAGKAATTTRPNLPQRAARPAPVPRSRAGDPPVPEGRTRPAPTPRSRVGDVGDPTHVVHRAHDEYGTRPSERKKSEQDDLDPLAEHLGVDAAAVHGLFSGHDLHALRQAMILHEVLGRPAAFRGDPYEP